MLRRLLATCGSLWNWRRRESELDEEIRFHLAEEADERVADGLQAEQAAAAARRDFGNVVLVRETTREAWGWGFTERLDPGRPIRPSDHAPLPWLLGRGHADAGPWHRRQHGDLLAGQQSAASPPASRRAGTARRRGRRRSRQDARTSGIRLELRDVDPDSAAAAAVRWRLRIRLFALQPRRRR